MGDLVWRWVQAHGPELEKRCRHYLKRAAKSYREVETYTRIIGEDKYLHRAVDKHGQTSDLLLTARRDARAAERFLRKALSGPWNTHPRVINVDRNLGLSGRGRSPQRRGHLTPKLSAAPAQIFEQRSQARRFAWPWGRGDSERFSLFESPWDSRRLFMLSQATIADSLYWQ